MDPEQEDAPETGANTVAQTRAQIRSVIREAGGTPQQADELIDADATIEEARSAAHDLHVARNRAAPRIRAHVGVDHTDPAELMQRQVRGFIAAATGVAPADDAREFAGLSTMQHLREFNERRGMDTRRMGDGEAMQRAFGTGDAPAFLSEVLQATVLRAYAQATTALSPIVTTQIVPDFRPYAFLRDNLDGGLEEIGEHDQFKRTPLSESKITHSLRSYARGIDISERAIRNDDKGLIVRVPSQFAAMARAKEAELLVGVIADNPVVDDGEELFSVAHNNLVTANTPISLDSVSDGRRALRSIVGLDGEQLLDIVPTHLVVGKGLETIAESFLATITPTRTDDVQPIKLALIVETRLGDYEWLLASASNPCLALLRLQGQEAPKVEQTQHWTTFGIGYRVSHHVNAAAIGWRGLAMWLDGEQDSAGA